MSDDQMNVYGVNPDGSTTLIGTAVQTPSMKIAELVQETYGPFDPMGDDEAGTAFYLLTTFHEWLVKTGQVTKGLVGVQPK